MPGLSLLRGKVPDEGLAHSPTFDINDNFLKMASELNPGALGQGPHTWPQHAPVTSARAQALRPLHPHLLLLNTEPHLVINTATKETGTAQDRHNCLGGAGATQRPRLVGSRGWEAEGLSGEHYTWWRGNCLW